MWARGEGMDSRWTRPLAQGVFLPHGEGLARVQPWWDSLRWWSQNRSHFPRPKGRAGWIIQYTQHGDWWAPGWFTQSVHKGNQTRRLHSLSYKYKGLFLPSERDPDEMWKEGGGFSPLEAGGSIRPGMARFRAPVPIVNWKLDAERKNPHLFLNKSTDPGKHQVAPERQVKIDSENNPRPLSFWQGWGLWPS